MYILFEVYYNKSQIFTHKIGATTLCDDELRNTATRTKYQLKSKCTFFYLRQSVSCVFKSSCASATISYRLSISVITETTDINILDQIHFVIQLPFRFGFSFGSFVFCMFSN